ncbi:MAG: hypothetical protein ACHQ50_16890, partial [Fimbriimonadales bacterium]
MTRPDHREEELLGLWIGEAGDPCVLPEAQFAQQLRKTVLARIGRDAPPVRLTRRRVALSVVASAALVLVGVAVWVAGSDLSWAQVVAAVQAKPWIRGTINWPDGRTHESWFSPVRQVAASRDSEQVVFDDYREKVRYIYDSQEKTLVREPESPAVTEQSLSFQRLFDAIFRGSAKLDNPIPGMEIVNQKNRHLREGGRSWIEYQLDLRADWGDVRLTFHVDPHSRLVESMTDLTTLRGDASREKHSEVEWTFDYPKEGPADIYALGVPRTATIDDRVPKGELARLYDGVKNSRDRFPRTYLAIVTHSIRSGSQPIPMFIWRKEQKWRREYRLPLARTPEERTAFRELRPPPAGPEAAAWWNETTKGWRMNPIEICDGSAVYGDASKTEKTEWKKVRIGTDRGSYRSYFPEIQGYPDLLGRSPSVSIELDAHPKDGSPGTVLLIARSMGKQAPSHWQSSLFWIDPARSYLVMQSERTDPDPEPGKTTSSKEKYVVDRVAQAPNGVWYP